MLSWKIPRQSERIYLILLPWGPAFSCQVLLRDILSSLVIEEEKFTKITYLSVSSIKIFIISACFWLQVFFSLLCSWQYIYKLINDMDTRKQIKMRTTRLIECVGSQSRFYTSRHKRWRGARCRFSQILLILKDVQSSPVTRFVNTSLILRITCDFVFLLWIWENAPRERAVSECVWEEKRVAYHHTYGIFLLLCIINLINVNHYIYKVVPYSAITSPTSFYVFLCFFSCI